MIIFNQRQILGILGAWEYLAIFINTAKSNILFRETDHLWVNKYKDKNAQKVWHYRTSKPTRGDEGNKTKSLVSLQEWADALMAAKLRDNWKKKKMQFIFHNVIVIKATAWFPSRLQKQHRKGKTVGCWEQKSLSFWHTPSLETLRMRGRNQV